MIEPVAPQGIDMITRWEGWHRALPDGKAAPYKCPAGVVTIAFGATYWEDGRPIKMSDSPITKEVGRQLLLRQLQSYASAVDAYVNVSINPDMRAALTSFAYNVGTGALKSSTLLKRVNARRWKDCPAEFAKWRNGGGRVLTGLLARRQDESRLFMVGVSKIAQAAQVPTTAPKAKAPALVDEGPWWAAIVRGILDGLGAKPSPIPV